MQPNSCYFGYKNGLVYAYPNDLGIVIKPVEDYQSLIKKCDKYEELFSDMMSATKIFTSFDKGNNRKVAVKTIYKNLLQDDLAKKQASTEFAIQSSFTNCINLVQCYEYSENDNEHVGI